MTLRQWAYLMSVFIIFTAVGVAAALLWIRSRGDTEKRVNSMIGLAFTVIAVLASTQLILVGTTLRQHVTETEARFANRVACTEKIVEVLEVRAGDRATGYEIYRDRDIQLLHWIDHIAATGEPPPGGVLGTIRESLVAAIEQRDQSIKTIRENPFPNC